MDTGSGATPAQKRRRGSRGGKNRNKKPAIEGLVTHEDEVSDDSDQMFHVTVNPSELPDPPQEGRVRDPEVAQQALVRRPQIGDTRPAPRVAVSQPTQPESGAWQGNSGATSENAQTNSAKKRNRRGGRNRNRSDSGSAPRKTAVQTDASIIERRRGRERNGRPVGRYFMCVQVRGGISQVAVLEGRSLIEHYVSRPADDVAQIHGNIYLGRVQNVLPGMEAAFVDIATPKNAVLYRGDVQFEHEEVEGAPEARIEQILRSSQMILCQVTKIQSLQKVPD